MALDPTRGVGWANGLALGIVVGSSIGLLRNNFVLGMGVAIGVGAGLGAILSRPVESAKKPEYDGGTSLGRKR